MARATGIDIRFKPILPNDINTKAALSIITLAVQEAAEKAEKKYFAQSYSTWKHKPKWTFKIKTRKNDLVGVLATSSKPYTYIERGTRSRWRKMSRDFTSKTTPGKLASGAGTGKATGFFRRPMKGIKARDFRVIVAERMQPEFIRIGTKAMFKVATIFFTGPKIRPGQGGFSITAR